MGELWGMRETMEATKRKTVQIPMRLLKQWKWWLLSSMPEFKGHSTMPDYPLVCSRGWEWAHTMGAPGVRVERPKGEMTVIRFRTLGHLWNPPKGTSSSQLLANGLREMMMGGMEVHYEGTNPNPVPLALHVKVPESFVERFLDGTLLERFRSGCGYDRDGWLRRLVEVGARSELPEVALEDYPGLVKDFVEVFPTKELAWAFRATAIHKGVSLTNLFVRSVVEEACRHEE